MAKLKGPDRVKAALEALALDCEVLTLPGSTRTAAEAAAALGCTVGEIAKSLVFRAGDRAVVAVLGGGDRLDTARLSAAAGAGVGRADAGFVRAATGFAIGGVPPLGHAGPVSVFMDRGLFRFARVWAAAGSPFSVFAIEPARLRDAAAVADLRVRQAGADTPAQGRAGSRVVCP